MFVNSFWGEPIHGGDPYNTNKERNLRNTDRNTYNCAGYALETFSWYLPCDEDDNFDCRDWGSFEELERNSMSIEFVNAILRDFDDVRLIPSMECLREGEYAFAFRVGVDDFHFVKQARNGSWYEKRGSNPRIHRMTEREVFHTAWEDGRYNGPIFLFAKKRIDLSREEQIEGLIA